MHTIPFVILSLLNAATHPPAPDPVYAPLWLYQGSWEITRSSTGAGAKPDRLTNECALLGRFFACAQTVNGKQEGLVIFIPADKPGHYYTQNVMPEGRATGRADLEIIGDHWTYLNRWQQDAGKIIYYKTTNAFTGKNRIHFEQAESADGNKWSVKDSGDEIRAGTPRK